MNRLALLLILLLVVWPLQAETVDWFSSTAASASIRGVDAATEYGTDDADAAVLDLNSTSFAFGLIYERHSENLVAPLGPGGNLWAWANGGAHYDVTPTSPSFAYSAYDLTAAAQLSIDGLRTGTFHILYAVYDPNGPNGDLSGAASSITIRRNGPQVASLSGVGTLALDVTNGDQVRIEPGLDKKAGEFWDAGAKTTLGRPLDYATIAIVWGVNHIPGTTPATALIPVSTDSPIGNSDWTTIFPCIGDYGLNSFVYVDPALAVGYLFHAEGSNFASFIVPNALLGGDDLFTLEFNGMTFTLHAGQEFKFTDFIAGGVDQFRLLGINPNESIDPHAPGFVSGFKFTSEGAVRLTQTAIVVPEPMSIALFASGAVCVLLMVVRRCKSATEAAGRSVQSMN